VQPADLNVDTWVVTLRATSGRSGPQGLP
jgi:hypothetical protein